MNDPGGAPNPGSDASAIYMLGTVLESMGRVEDAIAQFQRAVTVDPDHVEAHQKLGYMLYRAGRADEALSHYLRALAIEPNHAAAQCGLGITLTAVGRLDEARRAFDAAIKLAPRDPNNYFHLGRVYRYAREDPHFSAMQQLALEMPAFPLEAQIYLHFALAKAYADVEDYEESSRHLLQGNTLKRRQTPYDEAKTLNWLARVRAVATPQQKAGLGNPSSVPIFIVGMHRSGSTLVEQILASHPRCFGAGELPEIGTIAKQLRGADGVEFPEILPSLPPTLLHQLGASYLHKVRGLSATAERITDKMPLNFVYVGLINLIFPNARIIHTRRNPCDTAISCFSTLFGGGLDFSCELAELGRFYRSYRSLMAHWRDVLPKGVMLEVDYEQLVEDFEGEVRRILAHVGLDWDDACASFYRADRPVLTPSVTQVREPVHRRAVGRWRRYERLLEPFIQALEGSENPRR
jgi:tetratricopeptide (TPR) repeat protein